MVAFCVEGLGKVLLWTVTVIVALPVPDVGLAITKG